MASCTCHVFGVTKRCRLERIVRPKPALRKELPQDALHTESPVCAAVGGLMGDLIMARLCDLVRQPNIFSTTVCKSGPLKYKCHDSIPRSTGEAESLVSFQCLVESDSHSLCGSGIYLFRDESDWAHRVLRTGSQKRQCNECCTDCRDLHVGA